MDCLNVGDEGLLGVIEAKEQERKYAVYFRGPKGKTARCLRGELALVKEQLRECVETLEKTRRAT